MVKGREPSCPFSAQSSEKLEPSGVRAAGEGRWGGRGEPSTGRKGVTGCLRQAGKGERDGEEPGLNSSARRLQKGTKPAPKCWAGGKPREGEEVGKRKERQEGEEAEWLQFQRPAQ